MCRELGVSGSGYYAWRGRTPSGRDQADADPLELVKQVFERLRGNPGVRRVHAELITLGHRVSPKQVCRLRAGPAQRQDPGADRRRDLLTSRTPRPVEQVRDSLRGVASQPQIQGRQRQSGQRGDVLLLLVLAALQRDPGPRRDPSRRPS